MREATVPRCSPADLWLEALTAAATDAEEACGISIFGFSWTLPSKLHCWRVFNGAGVFQKAPTPADKFVALASFGRLHQDLHVLLLSRDAAAAQRTEAAAVAAARCCLRVARAVDGWQREQAATKEAAFASAVDALSVFIDALCTSPVFSCQAALRPGGTCVPGRRAVAAVIDMLQLVAGALQAVAGMPALRRVRLPGFPRSLPAGLCKEAMFLGGLFLRQTLPGRLVRLTSCVEGEQVMPMVKALLGMLCAQVGQRGAWACPVACEPAWQGMIAVCGGAPGSSATNNFFIQRRHQLPLNTVVYTSFSRRPVLRFAAQGGCLAAGPGQGRLCRSVKRPATLDGVVPPGGCVHNIGAPETGAARPRRPA